MKKYYLIARNRDTNSFSIVKLKEKWYKSYGSDEMIRGHLLSDIDLVTTRFDNEEEMANMMCQNGYISSANVDCYIVSFSNYHGKEILKTKEVLYKNHDSKKIEDLRVLAKYYSNPNSYPHPSGVVDHLLDKFCTKAFYNEEFRKFVLISLDTLPKNITRYFQKSEDMPPYRMKYESSWAKDNYSVLRSMTEAFERFDIFEGKDRQGQYMDYLNARNPYRKKIEEQIKRQIDPKNVEGQISLMDYEEFDKPITSSYSLDIEVDDATKRKEIREIVSEGKYKKITLLGQNVNSYGNDLKTGENLSRLLRKICEVPGDFKLSFMTSHPKDLTEEVINVIASEDKILKDIHLPAQSGNNRILKLMNRKYTREKYLDIIRKIREKIPNARITSDFIVGFPTETEEEFEDTMSLVREVKFDGIFAFMYSPREGTVAAQMEGQIDEKEKRRRVNLLLQLEKEIQEEKKND